MGSRYFITGVQIGILLTELEEKSKKDLLNEILERQYIGEKEQFDKLIGRIKQ
jgi:hypothetical protein